MGNADSYGDVLSMVHDPIDLRLADKVHVQVDYLSGGAEPLRLARVYHSNLAAYSALSTVPMGTGWRNYYDRSVQVLSGTQVRLHRANGRLMDFTFNGSTWISAMPAGMLSYNDGVWQYVNRRDVTETYNGTGRLLSLTTAGRLTAMQYDGSGRLQRVLNPFGRSLVFGYDAAGRVNAVTLPDGNVLRYGYDANNNLVSTRFVDGATRQYTYEDATYRNALTGVIDETGKRRLTWAYDSAGRPNYGHYGYGSDAVRIVYNGNQVTTTDARGTQRVRTYANVGPRTMLTNLQTLATADAPATGWQFSYDANGNLSRTVSRTGEVRLLTADARGRAVSAVHAAGTGIALGEGHAWHPVYHVPVQSASRGVTTNRTVDPYGRITQVSQTGSNGVTASLVQRVYNAQQLLQSLTNARGATTTFTYDAAGNRTGSTNALGQTTIFSGHDAHGRPSRMTRPDGTVVSRSFDVRGRIVVRSVGARTTMFSYDAANRLVQTSWPDGGWSRRNYDAMGQLASVSNHRGESVVYGRDVDRQVSSRIVYSSAGAVANASYSQFNSIGKLAATLDTRGNRTQYQYAADGRPSAAVNALGHSFGSQFDLLNRPVLLSQPNTTAMRNAGGAASVSTSHAYHPTNATHQSTIDTVGVATGYAADGLNRRVAESGADAGNISSVRNGAGDVTTFTDARGIAFSIARDNLGRVTSVIPQGTSGTTYTYVPNTSKALLAGMTDSSGSTAWTYDAQGRLMSKAQVNGAAGSGSRTVSMTRDPIGRVSSMTYPSGMRVDVSYNADVVSAIAVNGSNLLSGVTYLPMSQTSTGWRWNNGSTYSRSFDADGRVTSVNLGSVQRSYSYDAAGRVTAQVDVGAAGTVTSNFSYDEAGQLIGYSGPGGSFSYDYDSNGNRRRTVRNGYFRTLTYTPGSNRMLSSPRGSYIYNAAGNPTTDGYLTYSYDSFGRLTNMSTSDDRNYRLHNGQGMRVRSRIDLWIQTGTPMRISPTAIQRNTSTAAAVGFTTAPVAANTAANSGAIAIKSAEAATPTAATPNATKPATKPALVASPIISATSGRWVTSSDTIYLHDDQGRLLGEYTGGQSQETIWFNGQPVAVMDKGTLYNIRADNLGTPRSISRASDNLEVWRWDSDPFGDVYPNDPTGLYSLAYNLRFPGQQYDPYSGYYYNVMRDYDPYTGRYIQADPIGLGGGLSRYTYVGGNPISNIDPNGLASVTFGLFTGVGLQVTIGQNPNGSGFMSLQFGWGIGGGASYNPLGQAPGYCSCSGSAWTLGYGVYAQGSVRAGPVSESLGGNLGRNANSCSNDLYRGVTKSGSLKDPGAGYSASVSGGGQLTLSGGGSAQGGCTCGG